MFLKGILGLLAASHFIPSAWPYGTIIEVYPSTCPALLTGPAIPPMQYLLTITPGPINTSPRAVAPSYIAANGSTTVDCSAGAPFTVSSGQLSSYGQFVSATGLVPYSSFAVSSNVAAISTTFSVINGSTLAWNNTAFTGGHALFCIRENTVEAVFNGQLPAGCAEVSIGHVPISLCPTFKPSSNVAQPTASSTLTGTSSPLPTSSVPGSIRGSNVTANPIGCLNSALNAPAISGNLLPKTVTTLEQCVDFCSSYAYFGVQSGYCVCGNKLASSATPAPYGSCNIACTGNSAQSCGAVSAMAVYSIRVRSGSGSTMTGMSTSTGTGSAGQISSSTTATASSMTSYVTSTGTPNCFDRSPFDNTVNGGYLILCNTALPGYDLMSANGTNLAECIAACSAHGFGNATQVCVAVTFDITASSNQCKLKNKIGLVNSGAEDLSEAAIVVTGAYAPQIMFASAASTMRSTTAPTGSSSTATISGSMTNTAAGDSNSALTPSTSTSTSKGPLPTVSNPSGPLCPTYNGQVVVIGRSFYQVECFTDTIGETLTGNVTTATSLAECGGRCNLYNLAIPYGCVGVTLLLTSDSSNCYLKSRITGTQFRAQDDSLRLIYPGYPTPTDPILTATSTTMAPSSSNRATISTGATTQSSSSTGPTATSALCPAYNFQTLYFSSYGGSDYEIECSTDFADTGLPPVIATSLTDCISHCSFLNLNTESRQCVGVTFRNTAQTSPPSNNCNPKGSIMTIIRGVPEDDSARLIWQGYPSATDMGTTGMSSTPTRTLGSTTQSTSSTGSTSSIATAGSTSTSTGTGSASSTSSMSSTGTSTSTTVPSPTGSLCPTYSFQVIQAGNEFYEIECGFEIQGRGIGFPYSPYPTVQTFQQCLAACNFWNENTATQCIAADFSVTGNTCSLKDTITGRIPSVSFNAARLIYSAYPSITDVPSSSVTMTTSTTSSSSSTVTVSSSSSSTRTSSSASTSSTTSVSTRTSTSATSPPSGSSTISATATATASVYPAEPVCPSNNGGQFVSEYSNLYDIECSVDLRYAASNLASSGVLYAATFGACALFCDQYNLNAGAQTCYGFTWDSSSSSTTTNTNCVLKSSLIQTKTDNTANTIGVNSGRLLGPWPATNQVLLSRPIPLVTNTLHNGYSIGYDYATVTAPGGLNWQITEFTSPTLYVGANGFVSLSERDLNNRDGIIGLSRAYNNVTEPYTLAATILPTWTVAPYWTLGFAFVSTQQGIYYQIDTIGTGRFFISIEFFYTRWTTNDDVIHWITTYDTGNAGVWTSWFFSSGSADNRGAYGTVGHQGTTTMDGVNGSTIAAVYERGQIGSVLSGDKIVSNTNPLFNTCVRTAGAFNVATYGVPGTWSYTNSPA